jgi:hypothetical protein
MHNARAAHAHSACAARGHAGHGPRAQRSRGPRPRPGGAAWRAGDDTAPAHGRRWGRLRSGRRGSPAQRRPAAVRAMRLRTAAVGARAVGTTAARARRRSGRGARARRRCQAGERREAAVGRGAGEAAVGTRGFKPLRQRGVGRPRGSGALPRGPGAARDG